ncbi:SRPBCC family protein [Micromonospora humida]|uniref:SRPBCC family protein n=1 Tax=Micromonospora humida TaxID=2809018 RepID=UPI0034285283
MCGDPARPREEVSVVSAKGHRELFAVHSEIEVNATRQHIYEVVSDLAGSGRWSPECRGGKWISGTPGTVGAVFRGDNVRSDDVVPWAPVVRGEWQTTAEVVRAEPGRVFAWAMRNSAGERQDSVWSYEIDAAPGGSLLIHRFRMGAATEGIRGITADLDAEATERFFTQWTEKLRGDIGLTLARLKTYLEQPSGGR